MRVVEVKHLEHELNTMWFGVQRDALKAHLQPPTVGLRELTSTAAPVRASVLEAMWLLHTAACILIALIVGPVQRCERREASSGKGGPNHSSLGRHTLLHATCGVINGVRVMPCIYN